MSIEEIEHTDVMEAEAHTLIRLYKQIHDELAFRACADDRPPIRLDHDDQAATIRRLLEG